MIYVFFYAFVTDVFFHHYGPEQTKLLTYDQSILLYVFMCACANVQACVDFRIGIHT